MREKKKKNPKNVKYSCRVNTSKKMFWKRHSVQKKKKTNAMSSLKTQRKHSLLRYFRFSDVFFFFSYVWKRSPLQEKIQGLSKKKILLPRDTDYRDPLFETIAGLDYRYVRFKLVFTTTRSTGVIICNNSVHRVNH